MFEHLLVLLRHRRTLFSLVVLLLCGGLLMDGKLLLLTSSPNSGSFLNRSQNTRLMSTVLVTCSPRTNIAFLKNHKCASTAIQNILFRYGYKHNLKFALPEKENFFGTGLNSFRAEMMLSSTLNKLQPNIFAIHTKWNHTEVKKVMPTNTVFFTIVREPIALFEAFYAFSRAKKRTGLTLEQYIREVPADQKRENKAGLFHYNTMAWDFGMPEEKLNNLSDVWNMVMQADEQFGLVMIVERMEESLVLLADYLCWELSDMLVLDLNSLRNKFKKPLRQELRNILQKKLAPDYLIYRYFLKKFDQQVEAYGRDRMAAAVSRLRDMMAVLMDLCNFIKKNAPQLAGKYRPSSNKVEGFKANGDMCSLYTLPELSFLSLLRQKQRKEIIIHKTKTSQPPGSLPRFQPNQQSPQIMQDLPPEDMTSHQNLIG